MCYSSMRAPKKKFMTYIHPGGGEFFFSLKKKIYYSIYIYVYNVIHFYINVLNTFLHYWIAPVCY